MKKVAFALAALVLVIFAFGSLRMRSTHGQISQPATTGMVAPVARGPGSPGSTILCNPASAYLPFWNSATNQISVCDGSTWNPPMGATGAVGPSGSSGPTGDTGPTGATGVVSATTPIVLTGSVVSCPTCVTVQNINLIGTLTVSGSITLGALAGVATQTVALSGVTPGATYLLIPTSAPTTGFMALAGAFGAATSGQLTVYYIQPSVTLLTNYTIPVKVFRIG